MLLNAIIYGSIDANLHIVPDSMEYNDIESKYDSIRTYLAESKDISCLFLDPLINLIHEKHEYYYPEYLKQGMKAGMQVWSDVGHVKSERDVWCHMVETGAKYAKENHNDMGFLWEEEAEQLLSLIKYDGFSCPPNHLLDIEKYQETQKKLSDEHDRLKSSMNKDEIEKLEEFMSLYDKKLLLYGKEYFKYGFVLGFQMIYELRN